jgi:tyrosine-protein phosphatase YwqE
MFSIFKRKYPSRPIDFSGLGTDMHSHLLPGIDDGAADTTATAILKGGLEDLGFSAFITTPHIMWDLYRNTPETIAAAKEMAATSCEVSNLKTAAEYFLDEHFEEQLRAGGQLLTIQNNRVLVEFSFVAAPFDLKNQLFQLQIKGYQPVLAHPERYVYFAGNKAVYNELRSMGCLLQLNLLSLSGYYGNDVHELALWLVNKGMIDFAGTDLHHVKHLETLRKSRQLRQYLPTLMDKNPLLNQTLQLG